MLVYHQKAVETHCDLFRCSRVERFCYQQADIRSQQQIQQDLGTTRLQIEGVTTHVTLLQSQGGKQQQVALLQAQLSGLQQHYSQWQNALAQLELVEAQNVNFLRIAQP